MPPKVPIFDPQANDTFGLHLERLRNASLREYTLESKAAALMTTVMMMGHGSNDQVQIPLKPFRTLQETLKKSPSFRKMLEDPGIEDLVTRGDTVNMFKKFHELETQRMAELDRKYKRPEDKQVVKQDAELLKKAMEELKGSAGTAPTAGSPEIVRRGVLYTEMMKQLEYAQTLTEKGIQLSGEQTKNLITSIKAYNDGNRSLNKPGAKVGGEKRAEGFSASMTLLKQYMPAGEFNRYCNALNEQRGLADPRDPGYVIAEAFGPERVLTGAKTAKELAAENQKRMLTKEFSPEIAAEAVAIQQLSGKDPNKMLTPEAVRQQTKKLMEPGTAFMRLMEDERSMEEIKNLYALGEAAEVVGDLNKGVEKETEELQKELRERSRRHTVLTALGEIRRSTMRLNNGMPNNRYFTEQYLANILASEQLAAHAKGDEKITYKDFRERAEELRKEPAFKRLAERYIQDPAYRKRINDGLTADRSGKTLADAYLAEQPRQRERDQAQPQAQPRDAEVRQPGI